MCVRALASSRMREPSKGLQEIATRPRIGKFTRTQYQRRASGESDVDEAAPKPMTRERRTEREKNRTVRKINFVCGAQCEREPRHTVENFVI